MAETLRAHDLLLPAPVRVTPIGVGALEREVVLEAPKVSQDASQPAGGYRLRVDADGARISHADDAGLRHGLATLRQLRVASTHAPLVGVEIDDAPAIAQRGVMLDVSRDRVPRMDELCAQIGVLASLKANHLQLYTEHAFAYPGHEAVWRGSGAISPGEARRLDDACARVGIELVPNQNCFGHLTRWLERAPFRALAETHGDWTFLGMARSGPFSLCPTDSAALSFVESLLDGLLPSFGSGLVNVGCDETHDIGHGRSRDAVAARGRGAVYADFAGAVCRAALERGRRPMFWADIAGEEPALLDALPSRAIGMVWGYEPGASFEREARELRARGRSWWACCGTSSWRSFVGRTSERRANVREAASAALAHRADGMLVTDWGDLGHRQVWPVALLAIADGLDAAWRGGERSANFLDACDVQLFGGARGMAAWLEALGDADEPIRAIAGGRADDEPAKRLPNAGALFTELHPPPEVPGRPRRLPAEPGPWVSARDRLAELAARVPGRAGSLWRDECAHAVECALWAADVAIARRGGGERADLAAGLERIRTDHQRLWRVRSREGDLVDSLRWWDTVEWVDASGASA